MGNGRGGSSPGNFMGIGSNPHHRLKGGQMNTYIYALCLLFCEYENICGGIWSSQEILFIRAIMWITSLLFIFSRKASYLTASLDLIIITFSMKRPYLALLCPSFFLPWLYTPPCIREGQGKGRSWNTRVSMGLSAVLPTPPHPRSLSALLCPPFKETNRLLEGHFFLVYLKHLRFSLKIQIIFESIYGTSLTVAVFYFSWAQEFFFPFKTLRQNISQRGKK